MASETGSTGGGWSPVARRKTRKGRGMGHGDWTDKNDHGGGLSTALCKKPGLLAAPHSPPSSSSSLPPRGEGYTLSTGIGREVDEGEVRQGHALEEQHIPLPLLVRDGVALACAEVVLVDVPETQID